MIPASGGFGRAAVNAGAPPSDYMRVIWRSVKYGEDVDAMRVFNVLNPTGLGEGALYATLDARRKMLESTDRRDEILAREFLSLTSGRSDADELRSAFALGGWSAVWAVLEAQGGAHADRTPTP